MPTRRRRADSRPARRRRTNRVHASHRGAGSRRRRRASPRAAGTRVSLPAISRSSATERFERFKRRNGELSPLTNGPDARTGSPSRLSTLITSAPRSASCSVANGAAMNTPTSSTRTPSSAPGVDAVVGHVASSVITTRHYQNQPRRERRERDHRKPPLEQPAEDELALLLGRVGHDQRAAGRERARVDSGRGDRERRDEPDRAHLRALQERHCERNQRAEDARRRSEGRDDAADVADGERAERAPRRSLATESPR